MPMSYSATYNPPVHLHRIEKATLDEVSVDCCYGEIEFKGNTGKTRAKFIRISSRTNPADVYDIMINQWHIQPPQFFISVAGGTKDFITTPKFQANFRLGLKKVAQNSGAWFITGGINTGVTREVGNAVNVLNKTCIGIASWGYISGKENLIPKHENKTFIYQAGSWLSSKADFLAAGHSHYLLVDDNTEGRSGREKEFRSKFENYIRRNSNGKVPTFGALLIVGGGMGTLKTVVAATLKDSPLPVIVTKGSGRAADLFADALLGNNMLKPELLKLIGETYPDTGDDTRETIYDNIKLCVEKSDNFIVCHMDTETDIDGIILKALLKDQDAPTFIQMQFVILWDRVDLAQDSIFPKLASWQGEEKELHWIMIMALALDRVDFVRTLLNQGVAMHAVLTNEVLQFLYGYRSYTNNSTLRYEFSETDYVNADSSETHNYVINLLCSYSGIDPRFCAIPRNIIEDVIQRLCSIFVRVGDEKFTEELNLTVVEVTEDMLACTWQDYLQCTFNYPFRELFLWAVLNNMQEMALLMWEFEEEAMAKAIIAGEIYKSLYKSCHKYNLQEDVEKSLMDNGSMFKDLALNLLDECHKTNKKKTLRVITSYINQVQDMTCIKLATMASHIEYIAHDSVQELLNDVWIGNIKKDISFTRAAVTCCCCPLLVYNYDFKREEKNLEDNDSFSLDETHDDMDVEKMPLTGATSPIKNVKQKTTCIQRFCHFYCSTPIVKFLEYVFGYTVFVVVFIYQALIRSHTHIPPMFEPSYIEYYLIVTVFTIFVGTVHQFIRIDAPNRKTKIVTWISCPWKLLDMCAIVLFIAAIGSRFHMHTIEFSHMFYILDSSLWILRLLGIFYIHPTYGPYITMIGKMFRNMMHFMLIVFIFMVAYGVASTGILYPQLNLLTTVLSTIFYPYFNIIGELFMQREPTSNAATRFGTESFNYYAEPTAFVIMAIFLLITNILLMNLLVAVFVNSYATVYKNSLKIWKFRRCDLIENYTHWYSLPPPLSLIVYFILFWKWVISLFRCCQKGKGCKFLECDIDLQEKEDLVSFENKCVAQILQRRKVMLSVPLDEAVSNLSQQIKGVRSTVKGVEHRIKEIDMSVDRSSYPTPSARDRRSMGDTLTSAIIESLMGCGASFDRLNGVYVTESQVKILNQGEQEKLDLRDMVAQKDLRIEALEAEAARERILRHSLQNDTKAHIGAIKANGEAEKEGLKDMVVQKAMRIEELQTKVLHVTRKVRGDDASKSWTNCNVEEASGFSTPCTNGDPEIKRLQTILAEKDQYIDDLHTEADEKAKLYQKHSVELNDTLSSLEEKLKEEREKYERMRDDASESSATNNNRLSFVLSSASKRSSRSYEAEA